MFYWELKSFINYCAYWAIEKTEHSTYCSKDHFGLASTEEEIQIQLAKFWELEEIPTNKLMSEEEKMCEESFLKTHARDKEGRFVVEVPLTTIN